MTLWRQWFGSDRQNQFDETFYWRKLMESLLGMAWFVEARDPYTGGHLWRVSRYARLVADAMGLPDAEAARISLGGFLHDLGKIGVADTILKKRARLSEDEYAIMQTHPAVGLRMLSGHPLTLLVADAVGMHHERPDGRGYPRGLPANEIPLCAKIVSVCDAFDAMTSQRPYRDGMPVADALEQLRRGVGSQFDEVVVAEFINVDTQALLTPIVRHSDDGIPLQTCPMCGPTLVLRRESETGEPAITG
jgi:HD-GYP domain-containing protein (c-di-GMP phosphodiesterase class II)